jgi:AcrR family transcriptional regulator
MNEPTTEPGARQRKKAETRQALLTAARRVLKARGLEKTTTREIAEQAGVAVGTFFVHFSDVNVLVDALLDEHLARTLDKALHTAARKGSLVEQLMLVCRKLFESYDVDPALSRAFLAGSLFQREPSGLMTARLTSFHQWVAERIDEAVARGELPELDRELAFSGFFSLYFGALIAGLSGWVSRKQQLAHLEASLRRFLLLEGAR